MGGFGYAAALPWLPNHLNSRYKNYMGQPRQKCNNTMERANHKLRETDFFRQKALSSEGEEFMYYFSAALSASRSVTFAMQKEHGGEDDFEDWYSEVQSKMMSDPLMRVLAELRNHVVKRTLITPVAEEKYEVVDERMPHPDFAGEPSIDGKKISRHKLDDLPQDVKSNLSDDLVEDFLDQYGDDTIESWINSYYYKLEKIAIEGSKELGMV